MKYELNENIKNILNEKNITFKLADINDINEILKLYTERILWFKENNIKQWSNYLENHPKNEFEKSINSGRYFILQNDTEIIGAFEISDYSKFWNDFENNAYYISKVVTKINSKKIGSIIIDICKNIAKENNKKLLRLNCVKYNDKLNDIYESYDFRFVKSIYANNCNFNLRECILEN